MNALGFGTRDCGCAETHAPKRIVLTGGPGAGKTAVLETVRRSVCKHVAILPEAASIVFGGGFPRRRTDAGRRGAQRAIFQIQSEVERLVLTDFEPSVVLCDRGTLDGLAYWPNAPKSFFEELGTTYEAELARYDVVIHLRTPPAFAYDSGSGIRVESVEDALRIDGKIEQVWASHPHRHFVDSTVDFMEKTHRALDLIRGELPRCCLDGSRSSSPPAR